ncbi:MAG: hypothetical protein KAH23_03130 [Kiritimatiellae bacterium]|nr:hypothetical protein [Kiritimatiellia bacterium]
MSNRYLSVFCTGGTEVSTVLSRELLVDMRGDGGTPGPQDVSRFLDLYLIWKGIVCGVYARDLNSGIDTTYGFGVDIRNLPLKESMKLRVAWDLWENPDAEEDLYIGNGWNIVGEVKTELSEHISLIGKLGGKSEGFFPGAILDKGTYAGAGIEWEF